MACKVHLDDVNEKLSNEINSLNTAVDNRYTKSEVDDKLKPINDKLIGDVGSITTDLSDRYTKKEVDDKLIPINNKFDDYVLKTSFDSSISDINTSLTDRYTKKEVDDKLTLTNNKFNNYVTTSSFTTTVSDINDELTGEEITDFKVGKPVFASGHVYKQVNDKWESSTVKDRSDCICSVVIDGSYKEFVGVITQVDETNGCITFASHGDVLFNCDDANLYQIGDVILYNGKILDEDYAMTLRIQQSIVGKVTGKINEHTLAIFMK
ncbi:hypothetical protein M9Y10_020676 [Tritrichomonas musculus]|uniref:Uncharacterized protein n=1 Tax=Tritrichomonas musculus TaxID=1915356 RepID=A0ABR2HF93_9EUKA